MTDQTTSCTHDPPVLLLRDEAPSASDCYQCGRCSTGCPVAELSDVRPHQIVRLHQLGQQAELVRAQHLWLCLSCGTCSQRCPNQVPVLEIIDELKAAAFRSRRGGDGSRMEQFHRLFHRTIFRRGRNHELGLVRQLKTTRELLGDLGMGSLLLRKGKLRLRARRVRDRCAIQELYRRAREVEK